MLETKKDRLVIWISIISIASCLVVPVLFTTVSMAQGAGTSDEQLIARAINGEARGESYEGQVAVGAIILNRVQSSKFPNTVAGVIYQPGAFSCLTDGGINAAVEDSAFRAARDAINGMDPCGGAIYYYNPAKSTNKWIFSRPVIVVIGAHRFCS
jgi:N-acetylmuramoyl-L-alanine amidase